MLASWSSCYRRWCSHCNQLFDGEILYNQQLHLRWQVTDVLNFFMVLPIIVIAFSLSFLGFNESTFLPSPENITESWSFMRRLTVTSMDRSPGEDDGTLDGFEKSSLDFLSLFKGPVWALLGDFEKSDDLYDSSVYASTLLWVYVLISNVVFVNM